MRCGDRPDTHVSGRQNAKRREKHTEKSSTGRRLERSLWLCRERALSTIHATATDATRRLICNTFNTTNKKRRQIGGNWGALEALATPQRRAFRRPPPAPADQPGAAPPFAGQRAAPEEQSASHRIEHLSSLRTPRPSRIRFVTAGHPVPPLRLPCPEPLTRCSSRHPPPLQQPSVPSPSRAAQSPPSPSRSAARKSPVVLGAYRRGRHTAAESIPGI